MKRKWKQLSSHDIRSQVVLPFRFGLFFCYIFKLNHTPSYEKKNNQKCPCVPMNDEGLSSLSFFSSERSSALFSMVEVRKGDFGTRVPNIFDILLISNNLTNSQKSNWKMLKISKKSPQRPLEFCHMFWHTCARFLINLCQTLRIRCLSKAFYKILQNLIGKYYIFCIGK